MWSGRVWRFNLETNTLSPEPIFRRWNFRLSPDGRYVAFIGWCADPFAVGKCIMDLETKTTVDIPPINHDPRNITRAHGFITWHPSQNYVRFVELISEEDTLRYVPSFSNADGTFYRDIIANWLPLNVQIN